MQGGIQSVVEPKEAKRVLQCKWDPCDWLLSMGANGTLWGSNRVLENEVLKEIAEAKGKTVAQICLRWALEEAVGVIVKSFNGERMKQNLEIFDWSLTEEELKKIGQLPQSKGCAGEYFVSENGPFKTIEEFWDGEI